MDSLTRQLAAVWFADIVGFTTLSSTDESLALDLVKRFQEITRRVVAESGGNLVKFTGDGALAYGESALATIEAATSLRNQFQNANESVQSAATLRIGIHIGELTIGPDGDVYGDGVNLASRLQEAADPGQVVISEDVWRFCRQRSEFGFRPLGRWHLKGLTEPVWVYEVTSRDAEGSSQTTSSAGSVSGPSLAVLPLSVLGVNAEAEFLAAGLHNDLLTELTRIPDLTVISRTSVVGYRDTDRPIPQIARELGVDTVVEGSIQSAGQRIRLNVQLIDARQDRHKWAEYYDREVTTNNLFTIQTELVKRIASSLQAELLEEPANDAQPPTKDLDAYRLSVEGRMQFDLKTEKAFRRAIELFEEAVEKDPEFAMAWVGLADALALMEDYGYGDSESLLARAERALDRALELAPNSAEVATSLGLFLTSHQDGPGALEQYERAIELRPGYADAHSWRCWISLILGDANQALASSKRSIELNPLSAEAVSNYSLSLLVNGRPEEALIQARRAGALSTSYTTATFYEGLTLHDLGRFEDAERALRPLSVLQAGDLTVHWAKRGPDVALCAARWALGDRDGAEDVLKTIARDDSPFAWGLANACMGRFEEALEAFSQVKTISAWPGMALHLLYPDVWESMQDDSRLDDLRQVADRSWGVPS